MGSIPIARSITHDDSIVLTPLTSLNTATKLGVLVPWWSQPNELVPMCLSPKLDADGRRRHQLDASGPSPNTHFLSPGCPQLLGGSCSNRTGGRIFLRWSWVVLFGTSRRMHPGMRAFLPIAIPVVREHSSTGCHCSCVRTLGPADLVV